MKKITVLLVLIIISSFLFAAFIPFKDNVSFDYYASPSTIRDVEESIPFGFTVDMESSIDELSFLANPEKALRKGAENLSVNLGSKDCDWWNENKDIINVFSSFDPAFPEFNSSPQLDLFNVREYLSTTFLSSNYGDSRRAYVVANLAGNKEVFPAPSALGGGLNLALSFYGEKIKDNFAWGWNVNTGFRGDNELLGEGKNTLYFDLRAMFGYAFSLGDNFTVGISTRPIVRMETSVFPSSFVLARLEDSFVGIFGDDFRFGFGIEINAGVGYRVNDSLSLTLDLRNIPSMRNYWSLTLLDLASFNLNFNKIQDTWIEVPDLAFALRWKKGGHSMEVEIRNVVSQLIWKSEVSDYSFSFLECPRLKYSYTFSSGLVLSGTLGDKNISFIIDWKGMEWEIFYGSEDYHHIGIKMGYHL